MRDYYNNGEPVVRRIYQVGSENVPPTVALAGRPDAGVTEVFDAAVGPHVVDQSRARLARRFGSLSLPDRRLERLAVVMGSQSVVPAEIVLWEYPGRGLGFGAEADPAWVGEIRTADALAFVVRAGPKQFEAAVLEATEDFVTELALWDLEVVEGAQARAHQRAISGPRAERRDAQNTAELLDRVRANLTTSVTFDKGMLTLEERRELRGFALLTLKPRVVFVNVSDDDARVMEHATNISPARAVIAGSTESEIWYLEPDEACAFREELGLTGTAPDRIGQAIVAATGLQIFYTANRVAASSWLLPGGANAIDAARTVHSDFAERFIRAEVSPADEVIEAGGLAALRVSGRLRNVGRDHPLEDRDFLQIHFSR